MSSKKLPPPIVYLTDFGTSDIYVGVMKGVVYSICPAARIVDLSHNVSAQNIFEAAFLLSSAIGFFPFQTIFCVVVDPGVGSKRKPILIQTRNFFFIGPDNGVLWQAAQADQIQKIIHLDRPEWFLDNISATFHGRDIFSPVAAHLANAVHDVTQFGSVINHMVPLDLPCATQTDQQMELTAIHVDHFGNVTLNISQDQFNIFTQQARFIIQGAEFEVNHLFKTYADAPDNILFLILSSNRYLEISLKNSNAAAIYDIHTGDKMILKRVSDNLT